MPLYMREIDHAVSDCDVFIAIGTSGHVYPAAGLLGIAQACGACIALCPVDALTLEGLLAIVDEPKCTHCSANFFGHF